MAHQYMAGHPHFLASDCMLSTLLAHGVPVIGEMLAAIDNALLGSG
jgi:hypothetical protein